MDEAKKSAFLQHARSLGGDDRAVAISLDQYFDGNDGEDDYGGIAANTEFVHADIRRALERLRAHPAVGEVFVELDLLEYKGDYPEGEWPYANGVGVFTTLSSGQVDDVLAEVTTDPASGPEIHHEPALPGEPPMPPGMHYIGVWWD